MVMYCLENKRIATSYSEIEKEIHSLMGEGFNPHPDLFFRRLPLRAFSLPREALWCLLYFHQGRNKTTGLYYSKRTLQTKAGKPFRLGETIRLLEKEGFLIRHSGWGWFVPQEDVKTGVKYPALRASFLTGFFENPTKERRIALRYLLHLASLKGAKVTYRNIQAALSCSTELARYLTHFYEAHQIGILSLKRIENRVYNWSKEAQKGNGVGFLKTTIVPEVGKSIKGDKRPPFTSEIAPNQDTGTPGNEPKKAISCTESGAQYKGLNKEIQKKNPSTRPMATPKPNEGFSRSTKKVSFSDLGFETVETLAAKPDAVGKALEPYRSQFESEEAYQALEILFASARGKAPYRDLAADQLAMFIVDIWLEMLRRKSGFRTSVLGYFFSALRNNLATGYCRIGQKKEALEHRKQKEKEESRWQLGKSLRHIDSRTLARIKALCVEKDPGFHEIPFREYARKIDLMQEAFEELKERGDLGAFEVALHEFCEASPNNRDNPLRFVMANPDLWKAYCEGQTLRKAAA